MKCYEQVPRFFSQGAGFGVALASPDPSTVGSVGCCSPKGPGLGDAGGGFSLPRNINLLRQAL